MASPRSSQESILRPPVPPRACKSGTITTSNSSPLDLWMVINCTPHSRRPRIGQGGQLVERRSQGGAQQVFFAVGQMVEAAPQQVEIGAGRGIHAGRAAQAKPDLLEPGPN